MKKIFSFLAIATVAATMFTSCKKNETPGTGPDVPKTAKLSLKVEKEILKAGEKGEFYITSDIAVSEDVVIGVKSGDVKILTVDPASVTIAKDKKTITGNYTAIADGKTTITIATTSKVVSVVKSSADVTVGAPGAEVVKMFTGLHEAEDDKDQTYFYAYHEDPTDPKPEGERANLAYFRFFELEKKGGIAMNFYSSASLEMPMGVGVLKQQGEVGQEGIFLTPVTEGTAITFDAMVTSPWGYWENVYTPEYTALATGQDLYIVVACGDGATTSATYRAWAKINLGTTGDWSSLNVIEAYVCLNDGEFKVGQKS